MPFRKNSTSTSQALCSADLFSKRVSVLREYEKQLDAQDQVVVLGVFSILNDKELHNE